MTQDRYWPWKCLRRWKGVLSDAPVFLNSRLGVRFVYSRWLAGETIEELAADYDLHPSTVEQGLREWAGRPRNWRTRVEVRK